MNRFSIESLLMGFVMILLFYPIVGKRFSISIGHEYRWIRSTNSWGSLVRVTSVEWDRIVERDTIIEVHDRLLSMGWKSYEDAIVWMDRISTRDVIIEAYSHMDDFVFEDVTIEAGCMVGYPMCRY